MTRKTQNKTPIGDKILYKVKTPNGWSIIIMPDNILIDNYHINKAHIHPDPQNHTFRVELSLQDCERIYEIIKDYLNFSNALDIEELMGDVKMIITLVKKQNGQEFIREMEETYKSLSELEKLFKRTNNMKMYVDLENWKYYKENPDEMIETTESLITNKLSLSDLDLIILNTIKHEKPKSIRDLAKKINKDVSNIQPKVKKLEENGFIKFEDGIKNSKIPYLTFDEIKLEI